MPGPSLRILAVDDDTEDLELIEETVLGLEARASFRKLTNGSQVLPFLEQLEDAELPCLIILDYNMPEMTGSEVIAMLSNSPRYQTIPKIILSTSNASSHVDECMKNGAAKYFVKPNNINDLNLLIKEILSYCRLSNYYSMGK